MPAERRCCKRAEREVLRLANAHTVCSERERQVLLEQVPEAHITVIPNGVDTAFFAATGAVAEGLRQNVVFVGSMDYHANIDAALFFAKAIWPGLRERRGSVRTCGSLLSDPNLYPKLWSWPTSPASRLQGP